MRSAGRFPGRCVSGNICGRRTGCQRYAGSPPQKRMVLERLLPAADVRRIPAVRAGADGEVSGTRTGQAGIRARSERPPRRARGCGAAKNSGRPAAEAAAAGTSGCELAARAARRTQVDGGTAATGHDRGAASGGGGGERDRRAGGAPSRAQGPVAGASQGRAGVRDDIQARRRLVTREQEAPAAECRVASAFGRHLHTCCVALVVVSITTTLGPGAVPTTFTMLPFASYV